MAVHSPALMEALRLQQAGIRTYHSILGMGNELWSNGHIIMAKDPIFGLCVWDGESFVSMTEASSDDYQVVVQTINAGTFAFPWWEKLEAYRT